ncbi:MAG: helix-turn-helix transcriptional regulator [Ruminococcaceae bacterium]|nr:helix-turn-helix transcriptional regulator [Oscillospiraceae bacterium]
METYTEFLIFCKNIRTLRTSHGLSEREMAKTLRVSVKTLTQLENGILPPHVSASIILHLSKKFGIPPKDLFILL